MRMIFDLTSSCHAIVPEAHRAEGVSEEHLIRRCLTEQRGEARRRQQSAPTAKEGRCGRRKVDRTRGFFRGYRGEGRGSANEWLSVGLELCWL